MPEIAAQVAHLPFALYKVLPFPIHEYAPHQVAQILSPVVLERIREEIVHVDHPAVRIHRVLLHVGQLPYAVRAVELEYIRVHAEEENIAREPHLRLEFSTVAVLHPYPVVHALQPWVQVVHQLVEDILQHVERLECVVIHRQLYDRFLLDRPHYRLALRAEVLL